MKHKVFFAKLVDGSTVRARSAIGREPTGPWKSAKIDVSGGQYPCFSIYDVSGADYTIGDFCGSKVIGNVEIGTYQAEDHFIEVEIPA
jgi:hypothetical protein